MKKFLLAFLLIAIGFLFAETGYRYEFEVQGTVSDSMDYNATLATITSGANNIFSNAEVVLMPILKSNGSNVFQAEIIGQLPVRKQTDYIEFYGLGMVRITLIGATVQIVANDSLEVRLQEWAETYSAVLLNNGIEVFAQDNYLRFSSTIAGESYDSPVIEEVNGDLSGEITTVQALLPDIEGIDQLVYRYFKSLINITNAEVRHARDME